MEQEANSGAARVGLTAGLAVLAAVQVSLASAAPQLPRTPLTLRVAPQRPDLVRYNRVEALSLGVRGQMRPATPLGPLSFTATARFGLADRHPNGRLDVAHESLHRRVVLSGYHELTALDERARHFGMANTLMSLLAGRDDGDYYRRTGATAEWTPPTASPRTFRLRAFAEHHEGVEKETDVQLPRLWDDHRRFRPNIAAADGWEYGASLELTGRSGTDRGRTQAGVQAFGQAGVGEWEYARLSVGGDVAIVLPARIRLMIEAEGGTAWGSPAPQRLWYLGGPLTLRGYAPLATGGDSFGRARVELDRAYSFGRVVLFSDVGWAGDQDGIDLDDALSSAGAGLALADGILRVDGAWQLARPHDFRLDVYLDQIL